jgi:hypothetical protein
LIGLPPGRGSGHRHAFRRYYSGSSHHAPRRVWLLHPPRCSSETPKRCSPHPMEMLVNARNMTAYMHRQLLRYLSHTLPRSTARLTRPAVSVQACCYSQKGIEHDLRYISSSSSDGLRRVPPYWAHTTPMAKGRWVGRHVLEVLSTEFRDRSREYNVRIPQELRILL